MAATISKSSRPRNTSLLTRNGRVRIKQLSRVKLDELLEKSSSKRVKSKVSNRIKVLEKLSK